MATPRLPSETWTRFVWIVALGVAATVLVWAGGRTLERQRFGATDLTARTRVEAELRQRFASTSTALASMASRMASSATALQNARREQTAVRELFDRARALVDETAPNQTGLTLYDDQGPVAWSGRVSDLPRTRVQGPKAVFVALDALGPRLIRIEPVMDSLRSTIRIGTIVVEQVVGDVDLAPSLTDHFSLTTSVTPVALRPSFGRTAVLDPDVILISAGDGQVLVEATVSAADLQAARERWRSMTRAVAFSVLGSVLLLAMAPLLARRRSVRTFTDLAINTLGLVALFLTARLLFGLASSALGAAALRAPLDLVLNALLLLGIVWLTLDLLERFRVAPARPLVLDRSSAWLRVVPLFFAAGLTSALLIAVYERFLLTLVPMTTLDVLHFLVHTVSGARLMAAVALVLQHAAVVWGAVLPIRFAAVCCRTDRSVRLRAGAIASGMAGVAVAVALIRRLVLPGLATTPLLIALAIVGLCAAVLARPRGRMRRASQAVRVFTFYLALLMPAAAMYPSLHAVTTGAKERLIESSFGPEAATQRENLQQQLNQALDQIDTMPDLAAFLQGAPDGDTPATDQAFAVWSYTVLKENRVTSAVELYGPTGALVSRFALNLPEYTSTLHFAASCRWEVFEEMAPFGSSDRRVLRASRGVCDRDRRLGAVVVRVMLDYRALTFISSQNPYLESLKPERADLSEFAAARDIEFAVYGWSRAPIYASGSRVWPLGDAAFSRMLVNRTAFWDAVTREGQKYRVYYANDRGEIYALGYPVVTGFGHLVNLAELASFTAVVYLIMLGITTVLSLIGSGTPLSGRALLIEVRTSFYRKLLLFFVAAAAVPVIILALATRTYFATQLRASVEEAAVETATVAQRLVEDYATLQQRGSGVFGTLDDQIMVLVSRAIDQDVNFFDGTQLQATSERDLFASGLLPRRTPSDVYRRVVLDRLPTFVGEEEVGSFNYLLAAAPVRIGGREGVVTVPLTLRQREIELRIDEIDRRVIFGSVFFILLGAGLGYWLAERIADPVNRLTRATRRIARGDLDARVAATSTDELGRLVDDFNHMAEDLKRQRKELERTQRLEAWAEIARQVAHDIKNPLTPIQLAAEHAVRVNTDRGRPLSPVLDECVKAILSQVRLLRQISSEFSSFASSPMPRPEPTDVAALVQDVIGPYQAGLGERIRIESRATPDLPELLLDRTLFSRALTNVIENALHAMPAGGALMIECDRAPGEPLAILVRVTDSGMGMDPEAASRIFEPYFSTKATGTGLGLTIAKRNVELNGGTIAVDSRKGVGTTVSMLLPIR